MNNNNSNFSVGGYFVQKDNYTHYHPANTHQPQHPNQYHNFNHSLIPTTTIPTTTHTSSISRPRSRSRSRSPTRSRSRSPSRSRSRSRHRNGNAAIDRCKPTHLRDYSRTDNIKNAVNKVVQRRHTRKKKKIRVLSEKLKHELDKTYLINTYRALCGIYSQQFTPKEGMEEGVLAIMSYMAVGNIVECNAPDCHQELWIVNDKTKQNYISNKPIQKSECGVINVNKTEQFFCNSHEQYVSKCTFRIIKDRGVEDGLLFSEIICDTIYYDACTILRMGRCNNCLLGREILINGKVIDLDATHDTCTYQTENAINTYKNGHLIKRELW